MAAADPRAKDDDAPDVLRAGSSFGRYEILRCIGVGGMGSVFEATHTLLRKRVALKTLHANLGQSEGACARFLREAETVARIRHPNVVDISDVGIENGVPYLVMEFLEGENLARCITRVGALEQGTAVDILVPIAAGLAAVHRQGIVHRDIKPENIILARDAHGAVLPKLVDFGISKDLEGGLQAEGLAQVHTVTGTPHYMSPEQARGSRDLDGRTDQYALGILLYQCLTATLPYDSPSLLGLMQQIDRGEFRPVRELRPDVSPELEAVVHRAMARNVRDRFQATEAFGRALLPFASERVRLVHERDFVSDHVSKVASLVDYELDFDPASAATARYAEASDPGLTPKPRTTSGVRVKSELVRVTPPDAPTLDFAEGLATTEPASPKGRPRLAVYVVAGALVGVSAVGALLASGRGTAPTAASAPTELRLTLGVRPADALVELDGVVVGRGRVDRPVPRDGREHLLAISAPGYEPRSIVFRDAPPTQAFVELRPLPPAAAPPPVAAPPSEVAPAEASPAPRRAPSRRSGAPSNMAPAETRDPGLDIHFSR
ncbi:MAG: serine/threonine-protein kinase [Polyangiales bacterium]